MDAESSPIAVLLKWSLPEEELALQRKYYERGVLTEIEFGCSTGQSHPFDADFYTTRVTDENYSSIFADSKWNVVGPNPRVDLRTFWQMMKDHAQPEGQWWYKEVVQLPLGVPYFGFVALVRQGRVIGTFDRLSAWAYMRDGIVHCRTAGQSSA